MAAKKVAREGKMKMSPLQMASWVVITIGALNWGLVGLAGVDLIQSLFGTWQPLAQIIYIIVGLAGVYSVWGMFTMKK